jgi:hypothetical protein
MTHTINQSTTIDLSDYFFVGRDFNWKNVALTVEKWADLFPGEKYLELTANHDPATEPDMVQFWITYSGFIQIIRPQTDRMTLALFGVPEPPIF